MNKKIVLSFIAISLVVVSGTTIIALRQKGTTPITTAPRAETSDTTSAVQPQNRLTKKETALKEYSDPSGIRFLYPANLNIVVEQSEDPDMYASIKLKSTIPSDYISIKVSATNFTKLDDWLKANKISPASSTIKRMTLADLDAYQVPIQTQLATAAYDEGVIFTLLLTAPKNSSLHDAYDKVISNFTFYQPDQVEQSQPSDSSAETVDVESTDEEIIQ